MSTGLKLIARERARQITKEGWSTRHDDWHRTGELRRAGECYFNLSASTGPKDQPPAPWPWDKKDWKPKSRLRNLIRAGALFMAEAERLERLGDSSEARAMRGWAETAAKVIDKLEASL